MENTYEDKNSFYRMEQLDDILKKQEVENMAANRERKINAILRQRLFE